MFRKALPPGVEQQDIDEGRMPFLAHLGELRQRIMVSLVAIGLGFSFVPIQSVVNPLMTSWSVQLTAKTDSASKATARTVLLVFIRYSPQPFCTLARTNYDVR